MKQINNQKRLQLYFFNLFLSGSLAAEPIFLKSFCETYLPGFYYRSFTVPMSVVFGIVAMQQWRVYRGYYPITGTIILQQLKSKSFTQQCIAGIFAIRQAVSSTRQAYIFLGLKFWEGIKFHYQFLGGILAYMAKWSLMLVKPKYQPRKNSHSNKIASEPMALVWCKRSYGYFLLGQLFQLLLLIYIPVLFWQNVPRWGWFNTTLTFAWEAFLIFLLSFLLAQGLMNTKKRQQLGNQSGEDLLKLSERLQSLEAEGWRFEYRVVLPSSDLKAKKGDIDVVAISPDGYYSVIELKSHIGVVTWNSELKKLCRQLKRDPEPVPFKKDFFKQISRQAAILYNSRKLSRFPDRILLFWQAWVKIDPKHRLINKVKISEPSRLIKELEKRNSKLVKENGKNLNI